VANTHPEAVASEVAFRRVPGIANGRIEQVIGSIVASGTVRAPSNRSAQTATTETKKNVKEEIMRKVLLLGASALLFASVVIDEASAQRGMGGGFRGGGFGGGFRGGGFGGGFRAGNISGFRGGFAGGGFRAANIGGWRGAGWAGRPIGWGGAGWAGRRVAWGGGWGWNRGWGWRRGWGWGWPVAAGVGLGVGLATAGYYSSCWRWDGWTWVNVCYAPAYYGDGYPYY